MALDVGALRAALQQRIAAVPRMRQRLQTVPFGCGRPVWVDDPSFDIDDHLTVIEGRSETDDADLLDLAASLVTKPLSENRPLWAATFVPALTSGRAALILIMHHVVGDGLAGLAILRGIVDGSPTPRLVAFPRPHPRLPALARDAWSDRIRSLRRVPKALGRLFAAFGELGPSMAQRAQPSSLNKPTGAHRSLSTVVVDVSRAHDLAEASARRSMILF